MSEESSAARAAGPQPVRPATEQAEQAEQAEQGPASLAPMVAALASLPLDGAAPVPEAELLAYASAPTFAGRDGLLRFADALAAGSSFVKPKVVTPELLLVCFFLDRAQFAVPIARVLEILRVGELTRVPGAPPHIRGVTNVRGRIVPVVDLRTRLLLPLAEISPRSRILLVEAHGRVLGLLVDAVEQVRKVPVSCVLDPPEEIRSVVTDYVRAIARLEDRLIVLIDLERALLLPSAPDADVPEKNE